MDFKSYKHPYSDKQRKVDVKKENELQSLYEAYTFERASRGGEVMSYEEWRKMRLRDSGKE